MSPNAQLLYGVVTASHEYPEKLCFQLLQEVQIAFTTGKPPSTNGGATNAALHAKLLHILDAFENREGASKYAQLLEKSRLLKQSTRESLRNMLQNQHSVQNLEIKAMEMEEAGNAVRGAAGELKRRYW